MNSKSQQIQQVLSIFYKKLKFCNKQKIVLNNFFIMKMTSFGQFAKKGLFKEILNHKIFENSCKMCCFIKVFFC